MNYRYASDGDLDVLAEWNHQLIRDEGHRNPMSVPQLRQRMKGWIKAEYRAVLFYSGANQVAYALYREDGQEIYLRQFFVAREIRRQGIGRKIVTLLRNEIWPADKRITVEVLTANKAAVAFWRSVGFTDYSLALEIVPTVID